MDISCIILTWNSQRFIGKCLDALTNDLEQHRLGYEIFVVDNGSQDETLSVVRSMHARYPDRIIPLSLERNIGTTRSRNLALKQARGRYICVLDSDVEVSPGAISQLTRTLKYDRHIGLAAPKLIYPNGQFQKSTDVFPTVFTKILRYFFLKNMEKGSLDASANNGRASGPAEVDYAISAMWVFRREILERVGLLDENIFYAPEDVDYCLRIWKAGSSVVYDPTVSCVHHTQEISRRCISRATMQHILGLWHYFRKYNCFLFRPKRHS